MGLAGLVLLIAFDLGPALAINDDWGFSWTVRHFNWSHLHVYPASSALALPQIVLAVVLGQTDQRALRLTLIPFVALAVFCLYRLSRLVGADRFWSSIGALAPIALPVFMADATTFMSDVPCAALLLAFAYGSIVWLDDRSRTASASMVIFAALAILQRETAALAPIAILGAAALVHRGGKRLTGSDVSTLAALTTVTLLALLGPTSLHLAPPTQANRLAALRHQSGTYALTSLLDASPIIGFALTPFLAAAWWSPVSPLVPRIRRHALAYFATALCLVAWVVNGLNPFIGNVISPEAYGALSLAGFKPTAFPYWFDLLWGATAVAAFCTIVVARRRMIWDSFTDTGPVVLGALVISQVLPYLAVTYFAFDRYFIPAALLTIPLGARIATASKSHVAIGKVLALVCLVVSLGLYAVGEQDYQAWQLARDRAAKLAYAFATPYEVNAGYEANAVYGEIPYYDRTGRMLSGLADPTAYDFSLDGPRKPIIVLMTLPVDSPGLGVTYQSIAPAKISLVWELDGAPLPKADNR